MVKELTFTNMDQFKRHYLPNLYEREKQAAMSPEERGRYHAKKAAEKLRRALQRI